MAALDKHSAMGDLFIDCKCLVLNALVRGLDWLIGLP